MTSKEYKIIAKEVKEINNETIKTKGSTWTTHYGTVKGLGYYPEEVGGREVAIQWDGGAASRLQGGITDQKWEIFKLAFQGSGRINILSDKPSASDWMFDYRFLEAKK